MRPVLLSLEPWDAVWRRNQQLASRVPGTVFVEPARPGLRARARREGEVVVITPAKPLPYSRPGGRSLHARLLRRQVLAATGAEPRVTWATHAYQLAVVRALDAPAVYDRTDDWPAMEADPAAAREVARLDRALIAEAGTVVIVSEAMREQTRPDALLIPNGVDFAAFSRPPRRAGGDAYRIGFAGTLDPFRVDYPMLSALAALPGVEVLAAGPGGAPDGVRSLGVVEHSRIPEVLLGCDALVAPYRTDAEANRTADSLKLYEYFATGLPVIATATAGYEAHMDLVVRWPEADVVGACRRQSAGGARRQEIAGAADWSRRAASMAAALAQAQAGVGTSG